MTRFKQARILVVGDVMLDRYWWGSVDRISPEAPVPIVRLRKQSLAPGGAANVAVNVAALGGDPMLIGCCGRDIESSELAKTLNAFGVQTDGIITLESRRTTVKTRIVAHNQQVARIDQEDTGQISLSESAKLCQLISERLPEAELVIISDYAKGVLTDDVLFHLLNDTGKIILADPKGKNFSKYSGATVLTPNRREAADACNLDESMEDVVQVAGTELMGRSQFENVLITEGERGMTLFGKDATFHVDAATQEVFDVTGAGDTVIATLGVFLAAGCDLRSAVSLSNAAAGIAVGTVGSAVVTLESLSAELEKHNTTIFG